MIDHVLAMPIPPSIGYRLKTIISPINSLPNGVHIAFNLLLADLWPECYSTIGLSLVSFRHFMRRQNHSNTKSRTYYTCERAYEGGTQDINQMNVSTGRRHFDVIGYLTKVNKLIWISKTMGLIHIQVNYNQGWAVWAWYYVMQFTNFPFCVLATDNFLVWANEWMTGLCNIHTISYGCVLAVIIIGWLWLIHFLTRPLHYDHRWQCLSYATTTIGALFQIPHVTFGHVIGNQTDDSFIKA